ncbi:D-alanyl-D-alanine carboxypeptidase [Anaerovibrio sp. JC8]|uniref:D-alanyl-D-alanine carboxypeptidase family protein n=1 Tax=Anaerovibrio sp. JC8 TaxID=1240085 RepID=UPI000A0D60A1|nr:D-alanyl-D-alanine carboxypeptidase family protein [Anaerovibrio sp. JC8]ORU00137.1 D-alanyl-D-alanine carboxypeptidase [Anaerovibrio sp. JC8]
MFFKNNMKATALAVTLLVAMSVISVVASMAVAKTVVNNDFSRATQGKGKKEAKTQQVLPAAPRVTADAVVVMDNKTGEILYEKNGDKSEHPASLTKIMTAILVLDDDRDDRIITVSPWAGEKPYSYCYTGQSMRQIDMLTQMLMISDNVAASALAEAVGNGSAWQFWQKMNAKAKELGATRTHFENANGLTSNLHYSTARDLAVISRHAFENPKFRKIIAIPEKTVYSIIPQDETLLCENTNDLLTSYPGCIGGKTGYTDAAGGCLMVAAQRDGEEVLVVILHSEDTDTRFTEGAMLLDYGFKLLGSR